MQAKLFYKTSSPESHLDELTALADELKEFADVELIDVDSPSGTSQQELYDVASLPAVVVAGPDGSMVNEWKGMIPPAAEVRYWIGGV